MWTMRPAYDDLMRDLRTDIRLPLRNDDMAVFMRLELRVRL